MKRLYSFIVEYYYTQFAGVVSSDSKEAAEIKVVNYIKAYHRYVPAAVEIDSIIVEELNAENLGVVELLSRDLCA